MSSVVDIAPHRPPGASAPAPAEQATGEIPARLPAGEPHVRIVGVHKTYFSRQAPVEALVDIDLEIQRGEIFGIIGRSGAGKSSLIRTVNRLEEVSQGQVIIDGTDIQTLNTRELVRLRRRIGMIFQHFNLLSSATVLQNLALPLKAAGIRDRARIRARARELLALVGLEGKENVYPSRLSGGQKQRVGIARALMLEPDILLCDEATSALDPETTHSILGLIKEINRKLGLTVILITHEMSVISEICDRVAVLEMGRLAELGPVWRVFGRPRHEATRALLAPLQRGLADDLTARLVPTPPHQGARAVVRLTFDGSLGESLPLGALFQRLGDDLRLLQSDVERLQGHPQGHLVIGLPFQGEILERRLATLRDLTSKVEILGYVAVPEND